MNIALFASGAGSNVKNIIDFFEQDKDVQVKLVLSNKPHAGALQHASNKHISTYVFSHQELMSIAPLISRLMEYKIELIVLAGFLLKIPADFINDFQGNIINLHPSLLPKYGGKGMYGNRVHEAVLNASEKYTGITVHYVTDCYDEGTIIAQHKTAISENETIESLLIKIKQLEKKYFPTVIKKIAYQKK